MLGLGDELLVRVVVAVVDVGFVLNRRVVPAIVDAKGDKVDLLAFHRTRSNRVVL